MALSKKDRNPFAKRRKPRRPVVTPEMISKVEHLGGLGLTREQIHNYFGMSSEAWQKRVESSPELEMVMKGGLSKKIEIASGKLWEHCLKGNLTAIMFFLKTQGRWRETDRPGENGEAIPQKFPPITLTVHDPVEAAKIYQQIMSGS